MWAFPSVRLSSLNPWHSVRMDSLTDGDRLLAGLLGRDDQAQTNNAINSECKCAPEFHVHARYKVHRRCVRILCSSAWTAATPLDLAVSMHQLLCCLEPDRPSGPST